MVEIKGDESWSSEADSVSIASGDGGLEDEEVAADEVVVSFSTLGVAETEADAETGVASVVDGLEDEINAVDGDWTGASAFLTLGFENVGALDEDWAGASAFLAMDAEDVEKEESFLDDVKPGDVLSLSAVDVVAVDGVLTGAPAFLASDLVRVGVVDKDLTGANAILAMDAEDFEMEKEAFDDGAFKFASPGAREISAVDGAELEASVSSAYAVEDAYKVNVAVTESGDDSSWVVKDSPMVKKHYTLNTKNLYCVDKSAANLVSAIGGFSGTGTISTSVRGELDVKVVDVTAAEAGLGDVVEAVGSEASDVMTTGLKDGIGAAEKEALNSMTSVRYGVGVGSANEVGTVSESQGDHSALLKSIGVDDGVKPVMDKAGTLLPLYLDGNKAVNDDGGAVDARGSSSNKAELRVDPSAFVVNEETTSPVARETFGTSTSIVSVEPSLAAVEMDWEAADNIIGHTETEAVENNVIRTDTVDLPMLCDLLEKNKIAGTEIAGKDVLLLLGNTGSGKTSTLLHLCGVQFDLDDTGADDHYVPRNPPLDLADFAVAAGTTSVTNAVQAVQVSFDGEEFVICDVPGLHDTAGVEMEISNQRGIISALQKAKSVRPVLVLTLPELSAGRCKLLSDALDSYNRIFTQGTTSVGFPFRYVFTRCRAKEAKRICLKLTQFRDERCDEKGPNEKLSLFVQDMIDKTTPSALFVDLEQGDPQVLLRTLWMENLYAINDPRLSFNDVLSKNATDKLHLQLHCLLKDLGEALEGKKFSFALELLALLNRLANALPDVEAFWHGGVTAVTTAIRSCTNNLLNEANDLLGEADAAFAHRANTLKTSLGNLLLLDPLLESIQPAVARDEIHTTIQLMSVTITEALLTDAVTACGESLQVSARQHLFQRSLLRLKGLSQVFGGTEIGKAVETALVKSCDIAVAWFGKVLSAVSTVVEQISHTFAEFAADTASLINFAVIFSNFLVMERFVESDRDVFYNGVLISIIDSINETKSRAKLALDKYISGCHYCLDVKSTNLYSRGIEFENLGRARTFLISLLAVEDFYSPLGGGLSDVLHTVSGFDKCQGLYFSSAIKIYETRLGLIFESHGELSEKKKDADRIAAKLSEMRLNIEASLGWQNFDKTEVHYAGEALAICQSKLSSLSSALTDEALSLVRGLKDANQAAQSFRNRFHCQTEDAGHLLAELSEAQNYDRWSSFLKNHNSGVVKTWVRSLLGLSNAYSELENTLQALTRHVYGRVMNAFWIIKDFSVTGTQQSRLYLLLDDQAAPFLGIRLVLALIQLPRDSCLFKALFTYQNSNVFEKHLAERIDLLTECIGNIAEIPAIRLREKNFGEVCRLLSGWTNAKMLHATFASFCNVDPSTILTDRYCHQVVALQTCLRSWPAYTALKNDAVIEIFKLKKDVNGLSFSEMLACANEDARDSFYAKVAAILIAAHSVQGIKAHMDEDLEVLELYPLAMQKFESEINYLGCELRSLCSDFPADKSRFSRIYSLSGNLQSIEKSFSAVQPTLARMASDLRDESWRSVQRALDSYVSKGSSLSFNDLLDTLVLLKLASRDIPCWRSSINCCIDELIELAVSAADDDTFLLELSHALQEFDKRGDGHIGQLLLTDHKCFIGAIHAAFNDATSGQDIKYVLEGLNLTTESSSRLRSMYYVFEESYVDLISEHLGFRGGSPLDMNERTSAIDRLSDLAQAATRLAKDGLLSYERQVVALTSHIFAYWSLENSNSFALSTSKTNFLMKPHPAQVVAIWMFLNVIEGDSQGLQNHLLEVKTGEGKSVVLGVAASILALFNCDVYCVCYSRYLSDRDHAAFRSMFRALEVEHRIWYGTITDLFHESVGDYYHLAEQVITTSHVRNTSPPNAMSLRVMLVDEVDVFFGPDAFGSQIGACCSFSGDWIFDMFRHVWRYSASLSTSSLLSSQEVARVLARFPHHAHALLKHEISKLGYSANRVKAGKGAEYVISDGQLGYKKFDGLQFSAFSNDGNFGYIKELERGNVTESTAREKVSLRPTIGRFSHAELPFGFDIILGVTGTLSALSGGERSVLEDRYGIAKYTHIPSVFGANRLKFAPDSPADVIICNQKEDHFLELKLEIYRRQTLTRGGFEEVKRPIMIFFDSKKTLLEFYESSYMLALKGATRTITESAPLEERMSLFQKATTRGAITFMIRDFGRGTDLKCLDKKMLQAGGVHVIQAFFSPDASEETQIKGRCARQGADGSYSMVINAKQLTNDLGLSGDEIRGIINGEKRWKHLDQKRSAMATNEFKKRLEAVNEKEELHYRSHTCLETMLDGDRQKQAMLFFEELNGMKGTNRVFSSGVKNIKAKMLSERRKRLEKSFAGVRRKWQGDDSAKEEPLAAKIKASIQEKEMARIRLILADTEVCYFELLDVNTETPVGIIEESYRKLANLFDPDKNESEDAQTIFQALENARDVLLDDGKRVDYISRRDAQRED